MFDDFSGMGFFSRGRIGWKWMQKQTQKSIICLIRVIRKAQASWVTEREGNIAPPKLIGRNF